MNIPDITELKKALEEIKYDIGFRMLLSANLEHSKKVIKHIKTVYDFRFFCAFTGYSALGEYLSDRISMFKDFKLEFFGYLNSIKNDFLASCQSDLDTKFLLDLVNDEGLPNDWKNDIETIRANYIVRHKQAEEELNNMLSKFETLSDREYVEKLRQDDNLTYSKIDDIVLFKQAKTIRMKNLIISNCSLRINYDNLMNEHAVIDIDLREILTFENFTEIPEILSVSVLHEQNKLKEKGTCPCCGRKNASLYLNKVKVEEIKDSDGYVEVSIKTREEKKILSEIIAHLREEYKHGNISCKDACREWSILKESQEESELYNAKMDLVQMYEERARNNSRD